MEVNTDRGLNSMLGFVRLHAIVTLTGVGPSRYLEEGRDLV